MIDQSFISESVPSHAYRQNLSSLEDKETISQEKNIRFLDLVLINKNEDDNLKLNHNVGFSSNSYLKAINTKDIEEIKPVHFTKFIPKLNVLHNPFQNQFYIDVKSDNETRKSMEHDDTFVNKSMNDNQREIEEFNDDKTYSYNYSQKRKENNWAKQVMIGQLVNSSQFLNYNSQQTRHLLCQQFISAQEMFKIITGSSLTHRELLYFRKTIFAQVLPPVTRLEARVKAENFKTLEKYKEEVRAKLLDSEVQSQIIRYVFSQRRPCVRNEMIVALNNRNL
ncbi:hypothetical protein TRFO_37544 [Tritrichomonas foetus]|uniref:Uncharacterized protein n=1 Tax=Tritrichomonas foetus TaxID=1144522 RepID=A0A1J4JF75_9EUKA|nr:hypothetical protein TRFO_37544 [Tritrichomonas foetus]|eukprot:OHS96299.1 hypothetical protein TRFO_37544 [Tritrichomonas foetus]